MGFTVDERFHPDLSEAVRRLVDCFQPERIYLFGSRARGDAYDDSDYDILIVVPDDQDSGFRAAQRAYSVLWGLSLSFEVLVATKTEFAQHASSVSSLSATTLREGTLLYAA
jgi:predicted nucleotidyltransferase